MTRPLDDGSTGWDGLLADLDALYALAIAGRETLPDFRRRASLVLGLQRLRGTLSAGGRAFAAATVGRVTEVLRRLEGPEPLAEIRPAVIDVVCEVRAEALTGQG